MGALQQQGSDVDPDSLARRLNALEVLQSTGGPINATSGTIGGKSVSAIAAAAVASLGDYGPTNPLYIAHRGSAALYPEESKLAYDNTLFVDGEMALETDVQTLSDGSLGLMHDSTVDRTTTGTGAVNTFTATTFQALTMDSSVWLGSNYGDTLNPMMFQAYIDAYKAKALLIPEDKDTSSMAALVRALINSGVPRDRALIQSFATSGLPTAVAAGYQAIGLAGANTPTAATIAATGAQWAGVDSLSTISNYTAVGLKTLVFTVNRRHLRDQYLAQGASGFFSDDPAYLRGTVARSATDLFARQTWMPGMLSSDDDLGVTLAYRASFTAPNWWGYASATAPTTSYAGCLMGYMSPVANPQSFTLTFNAIYDAANAGDTSRWLSVFLGTNDRKYTDTADATTGTHVLVRLNGQIQVYRKDAGQNSVLLAQLTPGSLATGVEYTFQIVVTPTSITARRLSGGVSTGDVTATDSTYRGGYIQLGRAGMACRFRSLVVV